MESYKLSNNALNKRFVITEEMLDNILVLVVRIFFLINCIPNTARSFF